MNKEHLPYLGSGAVLGAILPALVSLNLFATKADIAEVKAYMAENYVSKKEVTESLNEIKNSVNTMVNRFNAFIEKNSK